MHLEICKKKIKCLFQVFIYTTLITYISAGFSAEYLFSDSFEQQKLKDAWQQNGKSGPDSLIEISDKTAFDGKRSLLLYDNDPKLSTVLDYSGPIPESGNISGYFMFPKSVKGAANASRAYTSIQLFGTKLGNLPLYISINASTKSATVFTQNSGEKNKIILPDVVNFDAWIPWRISWQANAKGTGGTCRIAVGKKETDKLNYSASRFSRLRLISGWSTMENNSVYYDLIRISKESSPAKQQGTGPFAAKTIKTVFADDFIKQPDGWSHWQPTSDSGQATYDSSYGNGDIGSLCLSDSMRCFWQRKHAVTPGKTYRLSGWVKTEQKSNGIVGLHIIPKIVSKETGKEIFFSKHGSINEAKLAPGFWQYFEVFWTAPASGDYSEGKLTRVDIAFFARSLAGKAWCDNMKLDEVIIEKPFADNFLESDQALKNWQIFSPSGIEGVAETACTQSGFADNGAIQVKHIKGKTGPFSAATILDRKLLGSQTEWTLLAYGKVNGDGKSSLGVEQLDENDKVIFEANSIPTPKTVEGWNKYQIAFSLLANTKKIRLLLTNSGYDSVAFDNVRLRPATANEQTLSATDMNLPVWMHVFPADAFAIIDNIPSMLKLSQGQTNAFCIQLAGQNKPAEATIVDIEMPRDLIMQTAQVAIYGTEPLKYEELPTQGDRVIYRFKNPYDWSQAMVRGKPNPYHGLLIVVKATGDAGTKDHITIRTSLGKAKGEERKINFTIDKALPPVAPLEKFKVGLWSTQWLNVRDVAALKELYKTYMDAGIKIGSIHKTHGFANKYFEAMGYIPSKIVHGPDMPHSYRNLPKAKRPDMMVLANGKTSTSHIALGLALNNPETNQAYKEYLIKDLEVLPKYSPYVISDIELWGDGCSNKSCFHPSTIAAFRKYAKIPESTKLNSEIILKQYYSQWSDFRNWITAELHGLMRRTLREIRPDLKLLAYDYTLDLDGKPQRFVRDAPMDTLRYDPHLDVHLISYYNYEGTKFLDHVDNDVKHLQKPVWAVPYIVDNVGAISNPNWQYHHPSAQEIRMEIVGSAASGAKGFFPFNGYLLEYDRLWACNEGVNAVAKYEKFYMDGKRIDEKVTLIAPDSNIRYRVHELNGKVLLTLFNCGNKDTKVTFKFDGKRKSLKVKSNDFNQLMLN